MQHILLIWKSNKYEKENKERESYTIVKCKNFIKKKTFTLRPLQSKISGIFPIRFFALFNF